MMSLHRQLVFGCRSTVPFSGIAVSANILPASVNAIVCDAHRSVSTTAVLSAEPLKKKKRMDPALMKAREDRRRRKIEKAIRMLKKNEKQLKPLVEVEITRSLRRQICERTRKEEDIPPFDPLKDAEIQREWCQFKTKQFNRDAKEIRSMMKSQTVAMQQLRLESEELYQEAIQIDEGLLSIRFTGPMETLPIENYESPDGDFIDITKKWD